MSVAMKAVYLCRKGELLSFSCMFQASCRSDSVQWVLVSLAIKAVYFTCAASVNYVLFLPFSESAAAANQCGGCWCQLRWEQVTCAAGVECVHFHAFYLTFHNACFYLADGI